MLDAIRHTITLPTPERPIADPLEVSAVALPLALAREVHNALLGLALSERTQGLPALANVERLRVELRERIDAAGTTFRIYRDGSTAKLVVGESTVELTPEQLRGMAEALASMAADIERERER